MIIKGATPIPFKVVTIAAGVAKMDLLAFIGASIIARAMRFYLVAALLYFFGQPIREFIEQPAHPGDDRVCGGLGQRFRRC